MEHFRESAGTLVVVLYVLPRWTYWACGGRSGVEDCESVTSILKSFLKPPLFEFGIVSPKHRKLIIKG